ncbi:NmrA family NAD(P)-binding protein [Terriglobus saanensis]|uniref:NmrA family protein n=1 Tax=Terriglobus saanensis (strain ATCC BAA-1853 / DSM 23119 / SP1PR4) TaxID=401053 RepID=E8V5A7_TERSS|nr:NmrA family NAD(P)-binding protein [Terriglobus saanensis]ADV84866.1 NmrA family protein [Terriglobus saanensis SP1PR4]
MYAIMGITGRVGGAVADHLLAHGQKVRAIVRNPDKAAPWKTRGAEIAIADYDDATALTAAFTGVKGVFIMVPPNFAPSPGLPELRKTLAALHEALAKALPKKAVYLSSIGAEQKSGLGLITASHLLEETLGDLPIAHAFLRAGWFMENSAGDVASASEGKIYFHLQPLDRKIPIVATQDIGRVGADTLLQDWTGTRRIEVTGPKNYSPLDIAAAFASALQHPVEAIAVPRDQWTASFLAQGMPEGRTEPRAEMVDGFNSGWIHFGNPGTEKFTGTTTLTTMISKLVTDTPPPAFRPNA